MTYRIELHLDRTATNTFKLSIRISDSGQTLLYDDDDFTNDPMVTLGAYMGSNHFTFNDVNNLDGFNIGANDTGPEVGFHSYQAAICIRSDTWCGAY